jgi:hypothetical protein
MTITIELPEDELIRVRAAAEAQGQDLNAFAVTAIVEAADRRGGHALLTAYRKEWQDHEDRLKQRSYRMVAERVMGEDRDALRKRAE